MTERKAVVLLMVLLAACEGAGTPRAVTRRDSAGIVIVESSAPLWAADAGWYVERQPVLDLTRTASGGGHEFFRVVDATVLEDGSIVVAESGSSRITFFGPDGRFVRAVGREGEGPGEFQRLTSVHRFAGDSLLAFDYWQGRITVLDPQGDIIRTVRPFDRDTRFLRVHPLENGDLVGVIHSYEVELPELGRYRIPWAIVAFDLAGGPIDTITIIPGSESVAIEEGNARALFGKTGHVAVAGDRIHLGSADSMQVLLYASDGRLERIVRVPGFDLRLTGEQIAAEREAYLPASTPPRLNAMVAGLPTPETRPAYSDLLVDPAGHVWARQSLGRSEMDQPIEFVVFSPGGEWLGSVRLPRRFTPIEIGMAYVLGIRRDELDVEAVQVLRLHRD